MHKLNIFLLVLIILGIGLLATQNIWVPRLVDKILEQENSAEAHPLSEWIGTTYPPLPKGVFSNQGGTVGGAKRATHLLHEVITPTGKELWFERIGKNMNTVVDALPFSVETKKLILVWGLCGTEDSSSSNVGVDIDDSIVALVNKEEYFSLGRTVAEQAWKANRVTEKFEAVSMSSVVCITETPVGYTD